MTWTFLVSCVVARKILWNVTKSESYCSNLGFRKCGAALSHADIDRMQLRPTMVSALLPIPGASDILSAANAPSIGKSIKKGGGTRFA
jgi:hypothetical protein